MRLSRTRGELPWKRERRAVAIERVFPGVVGNSDGADDNQPDGRYYFAADPSQLSAAFQAVRDQIYRLTQ